MITSQTKTVRLADLENELKKSHASVYQALPMDEAVALVVRENQTNTNRKRRRHYTYLLLLYWEWYHATKDCKALEKIIQLNKAKLECLNLFETAERACISREIAQAEQMIAHWASLRKKLAA